MTANGSLRNAFWSFGQRIVNVTGYVIESENVSDDSLDGIDAIVTETSNGIWNRSENARESESVCATFERELRGEECGDEVEEEQQCEEQLYRW